uniref:Uncharacterized protein n=2 Tax=Grammatophora oceanica TaxID=210454 RepID=A0A7S1VHS6_9STRA|mmetsp:Transcript_46924/g.69785  ORF Transcript_46924/g.69785 Transcript_46924/m.69785 type:complete len:328 (+) Transcript_46924:80-1063(+)|eukprot:CAMPEP_0194035078 /NCGR_PEP_ID=MMETSP0009_2-20130614/7543_1 /TAXON_ID=210454 /ORGANISM="Grammatophora oceanica, Strain CCMP 410" /LENGTH=327 /DNA_ID=CAMNT_0038676299 /DNA_START=78 /DNA_END=1061 /DNA_ORIENTATION=-
MLVDGFSKSLNAKKAPACDVVLANRIATGAGAAAPTKVLATSANTNDFQRLKIASQGDRELLADRRGPFQHLSPQGLMMSVCRTIAVQGSNMLSSYLLEQIEQEQAREELVKKGELTEAECDRLNEEWEEREWKKQMDELPKKIYHYFVKYHVIILLMRLYEEIASRRYDDVTLDRLTMDYFKAGLRVPTQTNDRGLVIREVYDICFWSNIIAYLADYSVHQVLLGYTYWVYYQKRRQRLKDGRSETPAVESATTAEEEEQEGGAMVLSFCIKSSRIIVSRALGLLAAAYGGALGTLYWPGWGTIIGLQMGDGMVYTAFDTFLDGSS